MEKTIIEKVMENYNLKEKNDNLFSFLEHDLPMITKNKQKNQDSKSIDEIQIEFLLSCLDSSWKYECENFDRNEFLAESLQLAKEKGLEKDFFAMLSGIFDFQDYMRV